MNQKTKDFIDKALPLPKDMCKNTPFNPIWLIDSGKLYNGSYGKNGFNDIIVIGQSKDGKLYKITEHSDIIGFMRVRTSIDVDVEHGIQAMRLEFNEQPILDGEPLSTCTFEGSDVPWRRK